jgi:hypothetical protein
VIARTGSVVVLAMAATLSCRRGVVRDVSDSVVANRLIASADTSRVTRYAKVGDTLIVVPRDSTPLPDSATWGVEIVRDTLGHTMRADLSPVDPGGDNAATYSYYFDHGGAVRAIEVHGATFHSGCTNVMRIRGRIVLNAHGDSVAGGRTLTDGKGAPVAAAGCEIPDWVVPPRYTSYDAMVAARAIPR